MLQILCFTCCWVTKVTYDSFWDHMDCSPPGSSVHGILQARTLDWGATAFSRGASRPRALHLRHWQLDSFPLSHQGSPTFHIHPTVFTVNNQQGPTVLKNGGNKRRLQMRWGWPCVDNSWSQLMSSWGFTTLLLPL